VKIREEEKKVHCGKGVKEQFRRWKHMFSGISGSSLSKKKKRKSGTLWVIPCMTKEGQKRPPGVAAPSKSGGVKTLRVAEDGKNGKHEQWNREKSGVGVIAQGKMSDPPTKGRTKRNHATKRGARPRVSTRFKKTKFFTEKAGNRKGAQGTREGLKQSKLNANGKKRKEEQ